MTPIISGSGGGGGSGAVTQIQDQTLGGAAASIDFAAIPGTFNHLLIVCALRGDTAAVATTVNVRFNTDAGANYDWEEVINATAGAASGQTSGRGGRMPANTGPASEFAAVIGYIANYTSAAMHKAYTAEVSSREAAAAGVKSGTQAFVWFAASAAITQVTLIPAAGNFVASSRATLYGLT